MKTFGALGSVDAMDGDLVPRWFYEIRATALVKVAANAGVLSGLQTLYGQSGPNDELGS
ncbi:MAG: hypothetical protein CM15mP120_06980 [Pseudomonadota bacterium]|nr:MAG: hypothetical protein CM15mP120_06980 [Pseudomonadota bacterium]